MFCRLGAAGAFDVDGAEPSSESEPPFFPTPSISIEKLSSTLSSISAKGFFFEAFGLAAAFTEGLVVFAGFAAAFGA